MVEVAHNVTRGKTAVHLDAVVKAVTGSFDDFVADVSALDVDVPSGNRRKVLPEKHGQRIGLLTGGAAALQKRRVRVRRRPSINAGNNSVRSSSNGRPSRRSEEHTS